MSETPYQLARAPLLGEHNEDIYANELGLRPEEVSRLKAAKVI